MGDTPKTNAELKAEVAQLRQRVEELSAEITERNVTLAESEARYQLLFNSAPGAIFIADAETGILVDVNVAAEKLLQKSRDEIIGMHHTDLHMPNRKAYVQSVFKVQTQALSSDKLEQISGTVHRSDGEKIPAEITLRLVTLDDKPHLMGIFHDMSERNAMEDALRRSETLFRRLVEEANDGILIVDETGKIIVFNATQEKLTGYSAQEVIGMKAVDLQFSALPPEQQTPEFYKHLETAMKQILTTGKHPRLIGIHRYQFTGRNGNTRTTQKSAFTIKTDKGYKLISFDRDITEEVKTQTKLRVLSEAVGQSKNSIIITNRDGVIGYVNSGFEAMTGYSSQEVIGKTPRILKSELHKPDFYENLWRTILNGDVFRDYVINRKKDGSTYTEDKTISPIKDEHGNISHFVSVGRDASKLLKIQQDLIENRERYKLATVSGQVGVWDWNLKDQTLYFDQHLGETFGFDKTEASANFENWMKLFHPDDLVKVAQAARDYIEGKAKEYKVTHRKVLKDGSVRWALTRGVAVRDEKGVIYRMVGTVVDITELVEARQAEEAQRLQAETMQEVVLALISHTDMDAVLDEILRQVKRLTHYATANIALYKEKCLSVASAMGYENFGSADFMKSLTYEVSKQAVYTDVIQRKKTLIIEDTHTAPVWQTFEKTAWIRSYLGMPIMLHNDVVGVLQLDSDKVGTFSQQDADQLQPLVNAAAIALENARLYEQLKKSVETNRILLREVNHRVKNNLAALIGLLYIEKRANPECTETMDDLINRVRSMATAHEMLSATKWKPVSLQKLVEQVIRNISEAQPSRSYLWVRISPAEARVTAIQANNIALIINELTTNVIKHARLLGGNVPPHRLRIDVDIFEENKNIILKFKDNGRGFPNLVLESGKVNVGLGLVKNLVKGGLLGTIIFSNHDGANVQIQFPISTSG